MSARITLLISATAFIGGSTAVGQMPEFGKLDGRTTVVVAKKGVEIAGVPARTPALASAMTLPPADETFQGLRLPGRGQDFRREARLAQIALPPFKLGSRDLGITSAYDVLFFGEKRLIRIRIQLKSSGESIEDRWTKQLRRYFDFLDRDGDRVLNPFEMEFVFSNRGMAQMLQGGFAYPNVTEPGRTLADFDLDRDQKVSFDEFAAYYAPSAKSIAATFAGPAADFRTSAITEEMFKAFDTDKDGGLSRAELTALESLFGRLDADEDETLTAQEIAPDVFNGRITFRPVPTATPKAGDMFPGGGAVGGVMQTFPARTIPEVIPAEILRRYDRDKNLRLTKAEIPFGVAAVRFLDRNNSGEITVTKLDRLKDCPPDLSIEMTFSPKQDECRIDAITSADSDESLLKAIRKIDASTWSIAFDRHSILLAAHAPRGVYAPTAIRPPLLFNGPKEFLTEKDISGPENQFLRVMFDTVDRDSDGKMTRKEFQNFTDMMTGFFGLPLAIAHSAPVPSLFEMMDANADGRLSVREVRTSWDRLISLETTSTTKVTRAALQPQGSLRFGRANEIRIAIPEGALNARNTRSNKGPVWFIKLDRNGDGELSRSEFPGSGAEFRRMDRDDDGFISLEEAQAFDPRKPEPKSPPK